ncbi:RNase HII [Saccharopolyspora antimicrobica]|uniref:Ribonuclease HII n=1 Tax=Saccharopolyspora antimicrobica TaxID=455193 RepID=A0A1I4T383_9PSEU|nr:ribonuclease HII [Saccharopolyspora antimicrobica]RKT85894.1 RNase HII [Saccharopolyspora antimicrobica]SFM71063.1 RNase HII [Saccharopolyspora antimicrobica]
MTVAEFRPPRSVIRRSSGNWALQRALDRRGLGPVAGVDEAGRGACAGPLVVAACVLKPGDDRRYEGLTDSKALSEADRDRLFDLITSRALSWSTVVIPAEDVDALGIHVANLEGMRRSVARLSEHPGYVLTDGFRVQGLATPSVAVVKGDLVAACVAAASVLAKVTRDRLMSEQLHLEFPAYGFDVHKGYSTPLHSTRLKQHGPCHEHRWSYANVAEAALRHGMRSPRAVSSKPGLFDASEGEVVDNEVL